MNAFSWSNWGNNDRSSVVNMPPNWESLGSISMGTLASGEVGGGTIGDLDSASEVVFVVRGTMTVAAGQVYSWGIYPAMDGANAVGVANKTGTLIP